MKLALVDDASEPVAWSDEFLDLGSDQLKLINYTVQRVALISSPKLESKKIFRHTSFAIHKFQFT